MTPVHRGACWQSGAPRWNRNVCNGTVGVRKTQRYSPTGATLRMVGSETMLLRSHTASSEKKAMKLVYALVLIALPFRALAADSTGTIPSGSKVYVREMDGFGSYI